MTHLPAYPQHPVAHRRGFPVARRDIDIARRYPMPVVNGGVRRLPTPGGATPFAARPVAQPRLREESKVSYRCLFHVVWCTQYRRPVIDAVVARRLKGIIDEVVAEKDGTLLDVVITPTTVHLTVEVAPQLGIHRLVKAIKTRSAGILRQEFRPLRSRLPSLWTNAYLVTTVGHPAPASAIQEYIEQQPTRS